MPINIGYIAVELVFVSGTTFMGSVGTVLVVAVPVVVAEERAVDVLERVASATFAQEVAISVLVVGDAVGLLGSLDVFTAPPGNTVLGDRVLSVRVDDQAADDVTGDVTTAAPVDVVVAGVAAVEGVGVDDLAVVVAVAVAVAVAMIAVDVKVVAVKVVAVAADVLVAVLEVYGVVVSIVATMVVVVVAVAAAVVVYVQGV